MNSPEGLSDGVGAQVDDLQQVVSGTGEQLGAVVVQVQRRHATHQLDFPHDALRPAGHTQTRRPGEFLLYDDLMISSAGQDAH